MLRRIATLTFILIAMSHGSVFAEDKERDEHQVNFLIEVGREYDVYELQPIHIALRSFENQAIDYGYPFSNIQITSGCLFQKIKVLSDGISVVARTDDATITTVIFLDNISMGDFKIYQTTHILVPPQDVAVWEKQFVEWRAYTKKHNQDRFAPRRIFPRNLYSFWNVQYVQKAKDFSESLGEVQRVIKKASQRVVDVNLETLPGSWNSKDRDTLDISVYARICFLGEKARLSESELQEELRKIVAAVKKELNIDLSVNK